MWRPRRGASNRSSLKGTTMTHPLVTPLVLAGIASVTCLAASLWPESPYLAPTLRPLAQTLAGGWALWRLLALDRAWSTHRAWRHNSDWTLRPEDLASLGTPWWRRWWARPQTGLGIGRGFRWDATHTQALETVLARDGRLPVAKDSRGGYPALGAVGHAQPLTLPLPELTGHTGIRGTTRAGKTVLLEVLAAEAIRSVGATIILDPKGSRTLLARCAAEARRQGKPFALVTPAFPLRSASMNVLASAQTPSE